MRNTYLQLCDYGSRFRILKGGKISLVVSAFITSTTLLHAAPSGGVVTAGNANIAQNGAVTTITQTTQKAAINWQNFSIGTNETVNFNQPSVSAITLNRVVGHEKSIIDGALNANGQVFILNSNGVLFSKNASINTAGLVATTMNLSDTDFMNGNYNFKGDSTASIINQGTINISDSGYAALFGKEVINEGIIKATLGSVHVRGASEVTLNLNGNSLVNLTVDKGVLDALVENKGAIYADGGEVYLMTNAVNELLKGVVNNTGIVEANSIDDITGKIELFAHGGTANVSGTLEAKEGFVETSGETLHVKSDVSIKAKEWLLDPTDITITNGGGADIGGSSMDADTITAVLNGGTSVTLAATNNITVNEIINKSSGAAANLTLQAGGLIILNQDIQSNLGDLYFNGNVVIGGTGILSIDAYGGNVVFNNKIDGDSSVSWRSLFVQSSGTVTFNGAIGTIKYLDNFNITSPTTIINGGTVITKGAQTYGDIRLGSANTVLSILDDSADFKLFDNHTISNVSGSDATLTIKTAGDIEMWYNTSISSTVGKLNTVLWADADGNNNGYVLIRGQDAAHKNTIDTNGGHLWIGGGSGATTWNGLNVGNGSVVHPTVDGITLDYVTISSGVGDIYMNGKSASANNAYSDGIQINAATTISSTTGSITLVGTGGTRVLSTEDRSDGLHISGAIASTTGAISLTGYASGGGQSEAISIEAASITSTSGNIALNGDSFWMNTADTSISSTGTLTIAPTTAGQAITIGGTGGLSLATAYFNTTNKGFVNGFSNIIIGSATAGDITVAGDVTLNDKTTLSSSDEIFVNAIITSTNANNGGVYFNAANTTDKVIFDTDAKVIVNNLDQLQWINTALAGNYVLGGNIDASSTSTWNSGAGFVPIGNRTTRFTGTLDGLRYVVSGLTILKSGNFTDDLGLFGGFNGSVSNLGLTSLSIEGGFTTGGLIGIAFGGSVDTVYTEGTLTSNGYLGGIVGGIGIGSFSMNHAHSSAQLISSATLYPNGGLIGSVEGVSGTFTLLNSYATQAVSGGKSGGLIGNISSVGSIILDNVYANGSVTGISFSGGLIGEINNSNSLTIKNSYATGDVEGISAIGGLVGEIYAISTSTIIENVYATGNVSGSNTGTNSAYVGGLVGFFNTIPNATIKNSYASGDVSSTHNYAYIGGLVGLNKGLIQNAYVTGNVNGSSTNNLDVGGLVGSNSETTSVIENTYVSGLVSGKSGKTGGLVGYSKGSVTQSYWDTQTSDQTVGIARINSSLENSAVGKTTAEMGLMSTYTGWDIAESGSDSYPTLSMGGATVWTISNAARLANEAEAARLAAEAEAARLAAIEARRIIGPIFNGTTVRPFIPNFTPPFGITPPAQQYNVGGQSVQLVLTPSADMPTQAIMMQELFQMSQDGNFGTVRVSLFGSTLIQLLNGGISLPGGLEQQFFITRNEEI